jgi:hypothetical protein
LEDTIKSRKKLDSSDWTTWAQCKKSRKEVTGIQAISPLQYLTIAKKDMTLKEGIECIKDCVQEIETRFLLSQPKFEMKIVTKDGTKIETIE